MTDIVEAVAPADTIIDLTRQIDTLKQELDQANKFRIRAEKWERDFMRYSERIMQESLDRDWCEQYDQVMDEINDTLEIATIPEREEEVNYAWDETYTVTVRRYGSMTMRRGYDTDDIAQAAREENNNSDASSSEIIDAIRDGNYESGEFVDDSVELV